MLVCARVYVHAQNEFYYKQLLHVILEADKSKSAMWALRRMTQESQSTVTV